jgi:hypothetical protein
MGCSVHVDTSTTHRPSPSPRHCPPSETYSTTDADFQARLKAAYSITSSITRDEALTVIALDAARDGYAMYTLKALSGMTSSITHDAASEKCADILMQKHMFAAAKAVADQVTSSITKDRILKKIATLPSE